MNIEYEQDGVVVIITNVLSVTFAGATMKAMVKTETSVTLIPSNKILTISAV